MRYPRLSSNDIVVIAVLILFFCYAYLSISTILLVKQFKSSHSDAHDISRIMVNLKCLPTNTHLITEDSIIECFVSTYSEVFNYSKIRLTLKLYPSSNLSNEHWTCRAIIVGESSSECQNPYSRLSLGMGSYRFKVAELYAESQNEPGISFAGEVNEFFKKDLLIVSRNEENVILISLSGMLLSFISILIALVAIILNTLCNRRERKEVKSENKKMLILQTEQKELLKSIFGELRGLHNRLSGEKKKSPTRKR